MNDRMRELARARHRLQGILGCLVALGAFFAIPWIVRPLPTVPKCPWLADALGMVLPGLPENAARFAATFPWQTTALIGLAWALRRGARSIGQGQQELALQIGLGQNHYSIPKLASVAVAISSTFWLVVLALVAFLGVVSLDWIPATNEKPTEPAACECVSETQCTGIQGNCLLVKGEAVTLAIRSDRINHTGIWVDACATYSLRSLATSDWTDNGIASAANGFSFGKNLFDFHRFWWTEWLRPLPDARWFQVVGRVDSDPREFRALGKNASIQHCWQPPKDGELVLLVNDIIMGNNTGTMTLELRRLACEPAGVHSKCLVSNRYR